MDYTNFENCVDILIREKKLLKDISNLSKDGKDKNLDPKTLKRVADYVYYYGADWSDNDPFTPLQGAEDKCKVAQATRKFRQMILDLRETGKLELLNTIFSILGADGIHITVDDQAIDASTKDLSNQLIEGMNQIKNTVHALSDERKELAAAAEDTAICTKGCFNEIVKQLYKITKNADKTDDAVSAIAEKYILNNRDNTIFDNFIRDNSSSEN